MSWFPQLERIRLHAAPLAKTRRIEDQLIDLLAARAFYARDQIPRDAETFEAMRMAGRGNIVPAVQEITKLVIGLFEAYHQLRLDLESSAGRPPTWEYALADIRDQLSELLPDDFLVTTPWNWLEHVPRYLRGASLRLNKIASSGVPRDRQSHDLIAPHWQAYKEQAAAHRQRGLDDPELTLYRWMIEELRVSLFAQELGTSMPVSPQRLDKQFSKVRRGAW
jgi:ATP-dependent helicase HrpA